MLLAALNAAPAARSESMASKSWMELLEDDWDAAVAAKGEIADTAHSAGYSYAPRKSVAVVVAAAAIAGTLVAASTPKTV